VPATVQVIEVVTDKAQEIVPRREAIAPKAVAIARQERWCQECRRKECRS
jgi:hypothetical protein